MRSFTGWSRDGWQMAGWALVMALLAVNVYRAATQSITTDEAFTFNAYVDPPLGDAVRNYDANNHVLYSLLERGSVAALGISEFAVRLPSVLGGALYLWAAMRLSFYVFGPGWLALVSLAAAGGSPFVLDYLSAARGYGLGLALLVLALYILVRHIAEESAGAPYAAGLVLGLAVAANLVYVMPAVGLGCVFAFLRLREGGMNAAWELADRFVLPAVLTAFLLMVLPLSHAASTNYYYGAPSLSDSARSMAQVLFCPSVSGGLGYRIGSAIYDSIWLAGPIAAILTAVAGAGAMAALSRRGRPAPREACAALAGGALVISLAALIAAHRLWAVPYPFGRTGIYWVPLLTWATLATAARAPFARVAAGTLAALCVVQFALLLRVDYYGNWVDDAAVKRVVAELRARENGARRVRVAANSASGQSLRYYRRRYGMNWMETVGRDGPADYYVLWSADTEAVDRLRLTVLYRHPLYGMVLAR